MRSRSCAQSSVLLRSLVSAEAVVLVVALSACSSVPSGTGAAEQTEPVSNGPSATQVANLTNVDTSAEPTGPSIRELVTAKDVAEIIGRDDIVFAKAS